MNFRLPRQIIGQKIKEIVSKETKKQNTDLVKADKNHLKEIEKVTREICKNGLPKYLVCKKLPQKLGKGIFLHPDARPILKDEIIAPYSGEISLIAQAQDDSDGSYTFIPLENILLGKEDQLEIDRTLPYRPNRLYCFRVDAIKKGNFTRFINHSEKPNIVAHLFKIPPNRYGVPEAPVEVIYIAKKKIHPGEQLLICYEDEEKSYWGAAKIKPFLMTPKTFQLNRSLKLIH